MNIPREERTLGNKRRMVTIRSRNKPNYLFPPAYNYSQAKQDWDTVLERAANRSTNHSALYARNDFLKKSRILTGIKEPEVRTHSFITVIVISSMFLFFTVSLTAALVVFCRKKNSVFALQKCDDDEEEEDDADNEQEYELEEMHTDVEYEYESESRRHRPSSSCMLESPLHQPLMPSSSSMGAPGTYDSDPENDYVQHLLPATDNKHHNYASTEAHHQHPMYQRMVVTAVLENQHLQTEATQPGDNSSRENTSKKLRDKIQKKYEDFAHLTHTDIESEFTAYPMCSSNLPVISISYTDDPPSYDSLSYLSPKEHISKQHSYPKIPYVELTEIPVKEQCDSCKSCNVFTTVPEASEPNVLFVDLPPKPSHSSSSLSTSPSLSSCPAVESSCPSQSVSLPATPLEPPVSRNGGQWSSCVSITTALDSVAETASWSADTIDSAEVHRSCIGTGHVPRRPCAIDITHDSGIADLMSPLSPPPGFRNDDCFLTPADHSGVITTRVT